MKKLDWWMRNKFMGCVFLAMFGLITIVLLYACASVSTGMFFFILAFFVIIWFNIFRALMVSGEDEEYAPPIKPTESKQTKPQKDYTGTIDSFDK